MGIRIQPKDINIPKDSPFDNDKLNRKETVEILTNLVSSIEGPSVMSVDAGWGHGKTTFLRLWSQHLQNKGFPVVMFNAWETDFSAVPFLALTSELIDELQKCENSLSENTIQKVQNSAKNITLTMAPYLLQMILSSFLGGETSSEIIKAITNFVEGGSSAYSEEKKSVQRFRNELGSMAKELRNNNDNKPLMILIDELDRCRPSYAVELLEVAKHFFAVDEIVFVLAINRKQLSHSVKALYGQDFDANGYLKRFIDIDFVLPEPSRENFIDDLLAQTKIKDYFRRTNDHGAKRYGYHNVRNSLVDFFEDSALSLRQISQAIHRIGLVLSSLQSDQLAFDLAIVNVLILRTTHENLYHDFCRAELSDLELIDSMFPEKNSKMIGENHRIWFEVAIILGCAELSNAELFMQDISTPLFNHYKERSSSPTPDNEIEKKYLNHVNSVIENVELLRTEIHQNKRQLGFGESVRRIELFSNSLIENSATESATPDNK